MFSFVKKTYITDN